jgi:hypothetical protein
VAITIWRHTGAARFNPDPRPGLAQGSRINPVHSYNALAEALKRGVVYSL